MLGWIISLVTFFIGCTKDSTVLVITSGLFAIAGSAGFGLNSVATQLKKIADTYISRN